MPFETPTLPALVARAESDLSAQADSVLRRSDQRVLSRVHGGTAYGLYGFLGWIALQVLPDSCDADILARWAAMRGVSRTPATSAVGSVVVRGAVGVVVDEGVLLQAQDGRQYATSGPVTLTVPSQEIQVRAVQAGAAGNAPPGLRVSLVSPVQGVQDQAEVGEGGLTAGTDEETLEAWRSRVVRSFRRIPHGGDEEDYVDWATEVPGVTRAWARRNFLGLGTVGVFFVRDNDPDPIPSPSAIAAVQAHLDSKRPLCAEVYAMAPVPLPVVCRLSVTPDTTALRARVEAALRELFVREGDLGARLIWTHIGQAISETAGEEDHRLVAPASDVIPEASELPVFGGVEWL
ncbi:baseplate J/gp47 family protein [Achromobacter xylosoxidans]